MGFITQSEYAKIYNSIKQSTTSSSTPSVLILVALDVDAICACKMLTVPLYPCISTDPDAYEERLYTLSGSAGGRIHRFVLGE
jgi:hypothetical protein